jgi:hypothetical protein
MKLTRLQYKALKIYWHYHTAGQTVGQIFRTCWRQWLLVAILGAFVFLISIPASPAVGYLVMGLCIGAFFRDIGYYQVSLRMWPVSQQIIDWKRVSELIESHETGAV